MSKDTRVPVEIHPRCMPDGTPYRLISMEELEDEEHAALAHQEELEELEELEEQERDPGYDEWAEKYSY